MLRYLAAVAAVAALTVSTVPALAQHVAKIRTFEVSPDRHSPNEASFTSKAAIVKFTGRTSHVSGNVRVDVNNVAKADGTVSVDLTTLDTGIGLRNEHLRNTIEASRYPKAVFRVTQIQLPGNALKANVPLAGTVTGQMTLHGVTRTLTAPVSLTYLPQDDAEYRAGEWVFLESAFKLKLSDYQIALPAPILGVKVSDELDINFNSMAKAL